MKCQLGFTLLEIMVVVILISLTVTLVGVNLERDADRVAQLEARRFATLLAHVRDESILSGKSYAVDVDEDQNTYGFLESPGEWVAVEHDDILRQRVFPEYLTVRFEILQNGKKNKSSLLVVESSGEITPFRLIVIGDKYEQVVKVDDALNIQVEQVGRDST